MNLSNELRKLVIGRAKPVTGTVVETTPTEVKVRTSTGVQHFNRADATFYRRGDIVRLKDGQVSGKLLDTADLPVYQV